MIWTDLIEEFPEDGYIHPLHEGKGHDGRKYRPTWHAIRGYEKLDRQIVTDGGEELASGTYRCGQCGLDLTDPKNAGFPYDGDWYCSGFHASLVTGDDVDASEYNSQLVTDGGEELESGVSRDDCASLDCDEEPTTKLTTETDDLGNLVHYACPEHRDWIAARATVVEEEVLN